MKKKKLTKLSLKKETIVKLSNKQQEEIQGGGFTTLGNCKTKFTCCNVPVGCNLSVGCGY